MRKNPLKMLKEAESMAEYAKKLPEYETKFEKLEISVADMKLMLISINDKLKKQDEALKAIWHAVDPAQFGTDLKEQREAVLDATVVKRTGSEIRRH